MSSALSRTIEALDLLAANPRGLSVTEVAQHLGMSKATSSRLLAAMVQNGLVERDSVQRHFLDLRFWSWGVQSGRRLAVLEIARPHIAAAAKRANVWITIAVVRGAKTFYLESTDLKNGEPSVHGMPNVVPVYACAPGKAILAFSDSAAIEAVLNSPLTKFTRHTLATRDELEAELQQIRRDGFAINRGEHVDTGLLAVAAPVFDQTATPVAAVCCHNIKDPQRMQAMESTVTELAATISASLGYARAMHELTG